MVLQFPSENVSNLKVFEPVRTEMKRVEQLEVNPQFSVYRIPYNLNHIYFTHDFWLDSDTLIVVSQGTLFQEEKMTGVTKQILVKVRFFEGSQEIELTRISPVGMTIKSVVLSHNKLFLIILGNANLLVLRTSDFTIKSEITVNYPEYYNIGQLSLTADDRWLLFPIYLNTKDPSSPRKTEIATFMVAQELSSGYQIKFGHRPFPWMWSHMLCNPTNPNQISSALVKFTKNFPKTSECHQRLWLWDITDKANIECHPLYNQRKKGIFPRYELITHESWGVTGKYLTFVVRRNELKRVYLNPPGNQIIMNSGPNPWHCDGRQTDWVVFDTMNKDSGIFLAKTDNTELIRLCKQHTTLKDQIFHPHPIFDLKKRHVLFNGNVGGVPNLFRVKTSLE